AAGFAFTVLVEMPRGQHVPVAPDELGVAMVAIGGTAVFIVDIAGIDVAQAVFHRDAPRAHERRGRGRRDVGHFPIRVKRREVPRHFRAQILDRPLRHFLELFLGVVLPGNEESRDLEPYLGLVLQVLERLEHRFEVRPAHLPIKIFGESFQIDVGRVHVAVELAPRFLRHVAGGHGDGFDALFAARLRDVDGVFHENDRIVIGVGHAAATETLRRMRDGLRRRAVLQRVPFARLADIPVLAELAREIAAGGPERQDGGAGEKMIERFFLDRIDAEAARAAVGGQYDTVVVVRAHETEPALARMQLAIARTDIALDAPVVELVPVFGGDGAVESFLVHNQALERPAAHVFHRVLKNPARRSILRLLIAGIMRHDERAQTGGRRCVLPERCARLKSAPREFARTGTRCSRTGAQGDHRAARGLYLFRTGRRLGICAGEIRARANPARYLARSRASRRFSRARPVERALLRDAAWARAGRYGSDGDDR